MKNYNGEACCPVCGKFCVNELEAIECYFKHLNGEEKEKSPFACEFAKETRKKKNQMDQEIDLQLNCYLEFCKAIYKVVEFERELKKLNMLEEITVEGLLVEMRKPNFNFEAFTKRVEVMKRYLTRVLGICDIFD